MVKGEAASFGDANKNEVKSIKSVAAACLGLNPEHQKKGEGKKKKRKACPVTWCESTRGQIRKVKGIDSQ